MFLCTLVLFTVVLTAQTQGVAFGAFSAETTRREEIAEKYIAPNVGGAATESLTAEPETERAIGVTNGTQPLEKGMPGAETVSSGSIEAEGLEPAEAVRPEQANIAIPEGNEKQQRDIDGPAVPLAWQTIFSETFEGAFPGSSWILYGDPTWDDTNYYSHYGSWSGWCGATSLSPAGGYINNMNAWMVYGPFSLAGATNASVNFYYRNKSEGNYDYFKWMASTNGTNYYGWQISGDQDSWRSQTFDLTTVPTLGNLTGQSQVWIAFIFTSDSSNTDKGAYVDDIVIQKDVTVTTDLTAVDVYPADPSDVFTPLTTVTVGQQITPVFKYTYTGAVPSATHTNRVQLDSMTACDWTGTLPSTGTWYTYCTSSWTATAGDHRIRGWADVNGNIAEANESNNFRDENPSFSITGADLAAVDVYPADPSDVFTPLTTVTVGQQITPVFKYTYTGPVPSATQTTRVQLDSMSACDWTGAISSTGTWYTYCTSSWTATAGNHRIRGWADVNNNIPETNESNNYIDENPSFTVTCSVPGKPTLSSPANGATGVSTTPTLDWSDVSGATSYDVQVCSDNGCSSVVRSQTGLGSSQWGVTPALSSGNQYWWQARANNTCGPGLWTVIWSFTTGCSVPGTPSLSSPANGATGVSTTPTLDWSDVSGATSYDVQVCSDSGCSSVVRSQTGLGSSQWGVTPALSSGILYWWRARANNTCGPGPWSGTWSFTGGCGSSRIVSIPTGAEGFPGQTNISVPINVDNATGVAGIDITITFNSSILTATDVQTTPLTSGFSLVKNITSGQVVISMARATGIASGSGALVNVIVDVSASASPGATSPLTLQNVAFFDENAQSICSTKQDGLFTVIEECHKGDVNHDGSINSGDGILILRRAVGLPPPLPPPPDSYQLCAADVNCDGAINSADAILALKAAALLPTLFCLTPNSGPVGTSVRIRGWNFGDTQGSSVVKFNGVTATGVTSWAKDNIQVNVPSGATTGLVTVTVGGVTSNGGNFTIASSPPVFTAEEGVGVMLVRLPQGAGGSPGKAGVTVPITIEGKGVAGADIVLTFDGVMLEATGVELTGMTEGFSLVSNIIPGRVHISMAGVRGIESSHGVLAKVIFRVPSGVSVGTVIPLSFDSVSLFDSDAQELETATQDGWLSVGYCISGRITEKKGGAPIPGAEVYFHDKNGTDIVSSVLTDVNGEYTQCGFERFDITKMRVIVHPIDNQYQFSPKRKNIKISDGDMNGMDFTGKRRY